MRSTVRITTANTSEPFSEAEIREFLRVDDEQSESNVIKALIIAARQATENYLNRCLMTTTYTMNLDEWPLIDNSINEESIELLPSPVQSITSVKYYNSTNVLTTLTENTDYFKDLNEAPALIIPVDSWSYSVYDRPDAIEVIFVAGYATKEAIPHPIKHAMRMLIKHLYDNRDAVQIGQQPTEMPFGYEYLLQNYRIFRFM